ncbi:hypothetical protein IFM89_024632 [Coptis chinensis]|uniref:Transposase MuDR plant domain-containing protein n=1 Tax=Coptis chinensis TaxID=261450 RepID=A0A835I528_9MAGN|nr:hypothetical protein IFM89_024632 [Coptis chinensis]
MCFSRDVKENLIETDGDLRSLACYCYGMKIATVEIKVNVCMSSISSCSGASTSSSSGSSSCLIGGEVVGHKPYKFDFWWRNFDSGVGQRFALGASEFRCKLIEYFIVSGYKYELIKNDDFRVTAVCQKKNELNCQWCIHYLESCSYFEIKKINLTHTCDFAVKDYDHPPLTFYLVKTHILDFARDKPDLTFGDIVVLYTREYGLSISKYITYADKKLALKELYGDVALSYNDLLWYTKELKRRDPENIVELEINESGKFERVLITQFYSRDENIQTFQGHEDLLKEFKRQFEKHLFGKKNKEEIKLMKSIEYEEAIRFVDKVKTVFQDNEQAIIDELKKNAAKAIPVIYRLLDQKELELKSSSRKRIYERKS